MTTSTVPFAQLQPGLISAVALAGWLASTTGLAHQHTAAPIHLACATPPPLPAATCPPNSPPGPLAGE
ncbi:hypothetical protein PR002_g29827 [Phytophthora rubi]|uniref:Uncharacterized protein n=1 Tax=Phytophthora rubi TaxID=129364 RepID=A0A6A3GXG1_9STRA|nr:hypothetical protein PR002_g29827 [Phytophthora rubi]